MNTQELANKINKLSVDEITDIIKILNYDSDFKMITESSLNRLITTHMNKYKKPGEKFISWAIITTNKHKSNAIEDSNHTKIDYSEIVSRNSNLEKRKQFKTRIRNMGYTYINIMGGYSECTIDHVSVKDCPQGKLMETFEKSVFIPNISFDDVCKLSNQLYLDSDFNNNKTKQEIGRFGQDSFIYAGEETDYNAWLYEGKNFNQIQKFAKIALMKKGQYGYTIIKNKYFTLESKQISTKNNKIVSDILQLSVNEKCELLALLK